MNDTLHGPGRDFKPNEACRKLNPHMFGPLGAVEGPERKPQARRTLDGGTALPKAGRARVATGGPVLRVTIISCEHRLRDSDNPKFKPLRDAIARSFGLDDADSTIGWEYGQVETRGAEGTIVRIERL